MRFHILTLFPQMVLDGLNTSITGRAVQSQLIEIEAIDIRSFSQNKHGKVDDYPYGGGAGMVMQAQPIFDAYQSIVDRIGYRPRTIYLTPQGEVFHQTKGKELAKEEDLVFLCGHYEGIDERVLEEIVTDYISIGDYVLTGGELPAMVMVDVISRLIPGVLSNEESGLTESLEGNLLEYPQYSRPEVWNDKKVPEVLLSGHHKKIEEWRRCQSIERTMQKRPDLFEKVELTAQDKKILANKDKL
ncbi:MAG: tRNA (guanosine(37)-N1)-methyltransferase TrmD [Lachnospiraceae bacterium]|nr:tRNA (guanosine(37)-N1)-methyltransferase TrmD [Lachnospiraceae bacterium]